MRPYPGGAEKAREAFITVLIGGDEGRCSGAGQSSAFGKGCSISARLGGQRRQASQQLLVGRGTLLILEGMQPLRRLRHFRGGGDRVCDSLRRFPPNPHMGAADRAAAPPFGVHWQAYTRIVSKE